MEVKFTWTGLPAGPIGGGDGVVSQVYRPINFLDFQLEIALGILEIAPSSHRQRG